MKQQYNGNQTVDSILLQILYSIHHSASFLLQQETVFIDYSKHTVKLLVSILQ